MCLFLSHPSGVAVSEVFGLSGAMIVWVNKHKIRWKRRRSFLLFFWDLLHLVCLSFPLLLFMCLSLEFLKEIVVIQLIIVLPHMSQNLGLVHPGDEVLISASNHVGRVGDNLWTNAYMPWRREERGSC
jgi:hypothetical protein